MARREMKKFKWPLLLIGVLFHEISRAPRATANFSAEVNFARLDLGCNAYPGDKIPSFIYPMAPSQCMTRLHQDLQKINYLIETRNEDLKKTLKKDGTPVLDPVEILQSYRRPDGSLDPRWLSNYTGDAFSVEVFFFMLLPLVVGKLLYFLLRTVRPSLHLPGQYLEYPVIPLIYLQQTKFEASVIRERRNGIDWLGKKFLIRATDDFTDIRGAFSDNPQMCGSAESIQGISKNPWALIKLMTKFNGLYLVNQGKQKQDLLSPSVDEIRIRKEEEEAEARERLARDLPTGVSLSHLQELTRAQPEKRGSKVKPLDLAQEKEKLNPINALRIEKRVGKNQGQGQGKGGQGQGKEGSMGGGGSETQLAHGPKSETALDERRVKAKKAHKTNSAPLQTYKDDPKKEGTQGGSQVRSEAPKVKAKVPRVKSGTGIPEERQVKGSGVPKTQSAPLKTINEDPKETTSVPKDKDDDKVKVKSRPKEN